MKKRENGEQKGCNSRTHTFSTDEENRKWGAEGLQFPKSRMLGNHIKLTVKKSEKKGLQNRAVGKRSALLGYIPDSCYYK